MTKGKYIFIGEDGSDGFLRGVVYWLEIEPRGGHGALQIVFPRTYVYDSVELFTANWRIA